MKKVVVIGSGGSGKSTFARRLGAITGLEVIHLDRIFWRPNWEETPLDEWKATVRRLTESDSWIMDGNFGGTREIRLRACDTVIFLDLPRYLCVFRALKRAILYHGRNRPDMAVGCDERLDLDFLHWIWTFPKARKARLLESLKEFPDKRIILLRTRDEVRKFLDNLRNGN